MLYPSGLITFTYTNSFLFYFQLNTHEIVEICVKVLYQVELVRSGLDRMWGFSVEAELIENIDRQDELCVWVSRVEEKGIAIVNGSYAVSQLPRPSITKKVQYNFNYAIIMEPAQDLSRETKLWSSTVP